MSVRDALRDVASAPEVKVGPGDFAKAVSLIKQGQDIDFIGKEEHEFDAAGDISGTFEHWVINDGVIKTVKIFDPRAGS